MNAFTLNEVENVFEIGRTVQEMIDSYEIEVEDSKSAFLYALELSMQFEKVCGNEGEYYIALDGFVRGKLLARFGFEN